MCSLLIFHKNELSLSLSRFTATILLKYLNTLEWLWHFVIANMVWCRSFYRHRDTLWEGGKLSKYVVCQDPFLRSQSKFVQLARCWFDSTTSFMECVWPRFVDVEKSNCCCDDEVEAPVPSSLYAWRKNVLMTSNNSHRRKNETEMHIQRNGFKCFAGNESDCEYSTAFHRCAYPGKCRKCMCFSSDGAEAKVNDLPNRRLRTQ